MLRIFIYSYHSHFQIHNKQPPDVNCNELLEHLETIKNAANSQQVMDEEKESEPPQPSIIEAELPQTLQEHQQPPNLSQMRTLSMQLSFEFMTFRGFRIVRCCCCIDI